ncbi:MAG TPA: hypothetical protein VFC29_16210 [Candidatus Limnocylindrales bacterium]|nr:hypothetical protein [Candidatus Limnocylindrales bacterium]
MTKNDNRMRWIRNLEKLATTSHRYSVEYEIGSECRIPGLLDYSNGEIICAAIYRPSSSDGLTLYNLVLQFPSEPPQQNPNADAKGYYFKDGIVGELLALMSLFYRCRFYLMSSRVPPRDPRRSATLKSEHLPVRVRCETAVHPPLFESGNKNLAVGFADFLDAIRGTDSNLHQRFILACYHYARAVKEVGVDPEMVFIRLVSAIEVLCERMRLGEKEDVLDESRVAALIAGSGLSPEEKRELKVVFDVRKSKKRFVRFVEQHCTGFIRGGNFRAQHLKIKRKDLPTVLNTVYNARSRYLHAGEPMFLSMTTTKQKWDIWPMLEMIVDNRKHSAAEALPYAHFFEGLVRHCLLKYLEVSGL